MRIRMSADQLFQDLRYALRVMAANPLFCGMAAISLALGIGANTAIYSFMDAILMRALPVPDPQSLVVVTWRSKEFPAVAHSFSGSSFADPKYGRVGHPFPYTAFQALHENQQIWSSLFAFARAGNLTLTIRSQADVAPALYVSGDFFRGLALAPAGGRLLDQSDDHLGADTVVLSHTFAQRHFGDASAAVGAKIQINNHPFVVIGVAPREFFGVNPEGPIDAYVPLRASAALDPFAGKDPNEKYIRNDYFWAEVMGRLRPGVSLAQAQAAMEPVFHNFVANQAKNDKERVTLPGLLLNEGSGGLETLRRRYSKPLLVILTLVALILALACANIANLLLARSTARSREMAVRLSLGAGRGRVIRQLLTESVLLAVTGGVLGVLFAIWGIRFLTALLANGDQNFTLRAEINWHVLGVNLGLSLLTGLLFGLAPALQSVRVDLAPALKSARSTAPHAGLGRGWRRIGLGHVLVASQVAISLLLLVAAGLFVRTLSNLKSIELGFNSEHLLLFSINARQAGYTDDDSMLRFYDDLQTRLGGIPGARSVTSSHMPFVSGNMTSYDFTIPGVPIPPKTPQANTAMVGRSFFETMQIPILLGRSLNERDHRGAPPAAVVNEVFARDYFGDNSPVGHQIVFNNNKNVAIEIVGVSKRAQYSNIRDEVPPVIYLAASQGVLPLRQMIYEIRAAGDPLALANAVRQVVREANDRIPVTSLQTQEAAINQTIQQELVFARLCSGFAILALMIAAVGLYGSMAYAVARRTNEIGIRMALGARSGRVVWLVMREVLLLTVAGFVIGLPVAYAAAHLVESFLFGMKARDPLTLGLSVAVLTVAALAAGYGPAWRASRIDPMTALRQE
ncbi:MAG TPA: ABC transporter permease [Bryobacteraceae bacterium]|nr:ABC transporter permease [Bryobacteraceae bacterium]